MIYPNSSDRYQIMQSFSVIIVGAGPAGLACGAELAQFGYEAVIYEAKETPGGLNTWGIAPYKTRQADSLKEVELIKKLGVTIKTGINNFNATPTFAV